MTLWLIFAAMTAVAMTAVLWPLVRKPGSARSAADVAVYRDQLSELDRDLAAGIIGASEAEAARVEISRRLLAAADAALPNAEPLMATRHRRAAAVLSLVAVPLVAASVYLPLGSPQLVASDGESVGSLIAQAEAHLRRNPEDGRGWEILGPVYMRLERYSDAARAWRNALRILGESAERLANLGEVLTAEADGTVTNEAKAAFSRAISLDDTLISARYYLGLAAEQEGDREQAAKIWRQLIAEAPPGAFWLGEVRNALERVDGGPAAPGPSAAQMAAAAQQPPDQQSAMIRGMVERLAARLKQDGTDVDGWIRLIRSYQVLGQAEQSGAATTQARQALAAEPGKLQQFEAALKGMESGNTAAAAPASRSGSTELGASGTPDHQEGVTIQNMVERLAERLKRAASDPEGWLTLVRSYETLGDKEKAAAALEDGRRALAGDREKLEQFEKSLKSFNVRK